MASENDRTLHIEFCVRCDSHTWCTHHNQAKYRETFEKIVNAITYIYPQIQVIGNSVPENYVPIKVNENKYYDATKGKYVNFPVIGAFQIKYKGQLLFSKKKTNIWPTIEDIVNEFSLAYKGTAIQYGSNKSQRQGRRISKDNMTLKQQFSKQNQLLDDSDKRSTFYKHNKHDDFTLTDHFKFYKKQNQNKLSNRQLKTQNSSGRLPVIQHKTNEKENAQFNVLKKSLERLCSIRSDSSDFGTMQGVRRKQLQKKLDSIQQESSPYNEQLRSLIISKHRNQDMMMDQWDQQLNQLQKTFKNFEDRIKKRNPNRAGEMDSRLEEQIRAIIANKKAKEEQLRKKIENNLLKQSKYSRSPQKYNQSIENSILRQMKGQQINRKFQKIQQYLRDTDQQKNQKLKRIYGQWNILRKHLSNPNKPHDRKIGSIKKNKVYRNQLTEEDQINYSNEDESKQMMARKQKYIKSSKINLNKSSHNKKTSEVLGQNARNQNFKRGQYAKQQIAKRNQLQIKKNKSPFNSTMGNFLSRQKEMNQNQKKQGDNFLNRRKSRNMKIETHYPRKTMLSSEQRQSQNERFFQDKKGTKDFGFRSASNFNLNRDLRQEKFKFNHPKKTKQQKPERNNTFLSQHKDNDDSMSKISQNGSFNNNKNLNPRFKNINMNNAINQNAKKKAMRETGLKFNSKTGKNTPSDMLHAQKQNSNDSCDYKYKKVVRGKYKNPLDKSAQKLSKMAFKKSDSSEKSISKHQNFKVSSIKNGNIIKANKFKTNQNVRKQTNSSHSSSLSSFHKDLQYKRINSKDGKNNQFQLIRQQPNKISKKQIEKQQSLDIENVDKYMRKFENHKTQNKKDLKQSKHNCNSDSNKIRNSQQKNQNQIKNKVGQYNQSDKQSANFRSSLSKLLKKDKEIEIKKSHKKNISQTSVSAYINNNKQSGQLPSGIKMKRIEKMGNIQKSDRCLQENSGEQGLMRQDDSVNYDDNDGDGSQRGYDVSSQEIDYNRITTKKGNRKHNQSKGSSNQQQNLKEKQMAQKNLKQKSSKARNSNNSKQALQKQLKYMHKHEQRKSKNFIIPNQNNNSFKQNFVSHQHLNHQNQTALNEKQGQVKKRNYNQLNKEQNKISKIKGGKQNHNKGKANDQAQNQNPRQNQANKQQQYYQKRSPNQKYQLSSQIKNIDSKGLANKDKKINLQSKKKDKQIINSSESMIKDKNKQKKQQNQNEEKRIKQKISNETNKDKQNKLKYKNSKQQSRQKPPRITQTVGNKIILQNASIDKNIFLTNHEEEKQDAKERFQSDQSAQKQQAIIKNKKYKRNQAKSLKKQKDIVTAQNNQEMKLQFRKCQDQNIQQINQQVLKPKRKNKKGRNQQTLVKDIHNQKVWRQSSREKIKQNQRKLSQLARDIISRSSSQQKQRQVKEKTKSRFVSRKSSQPEFSNSQQESCSDSNRDSQNSSSMYVQQPKIQSHRQLQRQQKCQKSGQNVNQQYKKDNQQKLSQADENRIEDQISNQNQQFKQSQQTQIMPVVVEKRKSQAQYKQNQTQKTKVKQAQQQQPQRNSKKDLSSKNITPQSKIVSEQKYEQKENSFQQKENTQIQEKESQTQQNKPYYQEKKQAQEQKFQTQEKKFQAQQIFCKASDKQYFNTQQESIEFKSKKILSEKDEIIQQKVVSSGKESHEQKQKYRQAIVSEEQEPNTKAQKKVQDKIKFQKEQLQKHLNLKQKKNAIAENEELAFNIEPDTDRQQQKPVLNHKKSSSRKLIKQGVIKKQILPKNPSVKILNQQRQPKMEQKQQSQIKQQRQPSQKQIKTDKQKTKAITQEPISSQQICQQKSNSRSSKESEISKESKEQIGSQNKVSPKQEQSLKFQMVSQKKKSMKQKNSRQKNIPQQLKDNVYFDSVKKQTEKQQHDIKKQLVDFGVQKDTPLEKQIQTDYDGFYSVYQDLHSSRPSKLNRINSGKLQKAAPNIFEQSPPTQNRQYQRQNMNKISLESQEQKHQNQGYSRAEILKQLYGQSINKEKAKYPDALQKKQYKQQIDIENDALTNKYQWKRISELYKNSKVQLFDKKSLNSAKVTFGQRNMISFRKVIKIMGERNQLLITRLFQNIENVDAGVFGVWLCDKYSWKCVIVNQLIPVDMKNQIVFSYNQDYQLWPIILEKAMAKLVGGYQQLSKIQVNDLFHMLTGSNYMNFRIKEEWQKNKKFVKFLTENQKKNFIIYAQKISASIQQNEKKNKQISIFYIISQKIINDNEILLKLKESDKQPFMIKLELFVTEFHSVSVLQLRMNHNFTSINLPSYNVKNYVVFELNFQQNLFGSITLSNPKKNGNLKIFLYREQQTNILRLIGQAKEKQKQKLFFDCLFFGGKYFLFADSQFNGSRISYFGEGSPKLSIKQQIKMQGLKNNIAEYLPINKLPAKQSQTVPKTLILNSSRKGLSNTQNSFFKSTTNGFNDKASRLRQQFIEYLMNSR